MNLQSIALRDRSVRGEWERGRVAECKVGA